MNKYALSLVAASVAVATSAMAEGTYQPVDHFSGAYIGGGLGASVLTSNTNSTVTATNTATTILDNDTFYAGRAGFAGQVFAGYGQVISDSFYLGGEIFYLYNGAKPGNTNVDYDTSTGTPVTVTESTTITNYNNLGLALHLGYVINPNALGYLVVGGEYGQQKFSVSTSNPTISGYNSWSYKQNKWGYLLGLGSMTDITDNLLLGGEVEYAGFAKATVDSETLTLAPGSTVVANTSIKNGSWTMLARLAYRFDV